MDNVDKIRTLLRDALDANEVAEVALTEINHLVAEDTTEAPAAPPASKKKGRRKKKGNGKAADVTIEQVKEVYGRVIEEFGNRGAEEALEPLGVSLIRDLTADQYVEAIEAGEAYLKD